MKLIHHSEIEYDHSMRFATLGRFKLGDVVEPGAKDDDGRECPFRGIVVAAEEAPNWRITGGIAETIYVRMLDEFRVSLGRSGTLDAAMIIKSV